MGCSQRVTIRERQFRTKGSTWLITFLWAKDLWFNKSNPQGRNYFWEKSVPVLDWEHLFMSLTHWITNSLPTVQISSLESFPRIYWNDKSGSYWDFTIKGEISGLKNGKLFFPVPLNYLYPHRTPQRIDQTSLWCNYHIRRTGHVQIEINFCLLPISLAELKWNTMKQSVTRIFLY